MPVVAQINVNFASLPQTVASPAALPTNIRAVSPLTLSQYLLYNRDKQDNDAHLRDPVYINYQGGFLTAGDKVNVKHDGNLQLRQNLDVEKSLFVDSIFSRRKGATNTTYQSDRSGDRSLTLAPNTGDVSITNQLNFIRLNSTGTSRSITLSINFGAAADKENSITLNNDNNTTKTMNLKTGFFELRADDIKNFGPIYNSSTVEIEGQTTITDNIRITGNLSLGAAYSNFIVNAATGNVTQTGSLTINVNKFTVNAANGNTVIDGTLLVNGATVTIKGATTVSNSITFDTGGSTADSRMITGLRRVVDFSDITSVGRTTNAMTIGDFVDRFYHIPKNENSSYTVTNSDSQTTILCNNTSNINISLPAGLRVGTQVSFIRQNTGKVTFVGAGTTIKSAPTDSFSSLAFTSSVGTCFFAGIVNGQPTWYLFGDLLPP